MKRIVYILIFIAGFTFSSFAQNRPTESTAKLIKVYPIPSTSVVYFDFQSGYDRSYKFEVYSFIGKKVYELANLPQRIELPLDEFFRGFYYYKLLDKNGKFIESGRFIVVK